MTNKIQNNYICCVPAFQVSQTLSSLTQRVCQIFDECVEECLLTAEELLCLPRTQNYAYQSYVDNWTYGQYSFPSGVTGDQAFGVINADGSFDSAYPLQRMQGCTALAIGGWNNSQNHGGPNPWDNNGLYTVLTSQDDSLRQTLINNIVNAVQQNGYTSVVMDYENYENPPPSPALYTNFLIQLESRLKSVGATVQMAISPWSYNQRFYDIQQLAAQTNITFQAMCYDFAMGESPIKVISNAAVSQTQAYLTAMEQAGVPMDRVMVGVPSYGVAFNIDPSLSQAQVAQQLASGTLVADSYWSGANNGGNGQVPNDYILQTWIGDWASPQNGWVLMQDSSKEIYYYSPTQHIIVSAFPPATIDNFAQMIKAEFPTVKGFFNWEAMEDIKGAVMSRLIQDMN